MIALTLELGWKSRKARKEMRREMAVCMTSTGENCVNSARSSTFNERIAKEQLAEMAQDEKVEGV